MKQQEYEAALDKAYDELERFIVETWDIDKKDCLDAEDLDDTMADVFYVFSTGRGCQAAVEAIREQFDMSDLSSRELSTLTKLFLLNNCLLRIPNHISIWFIQEQ